MNKPTASRESTRALTALALALALLAFAGTASAQVADPDKVQVRVLPQPEVFGDTYTLGEIAELDGFDIKLLKELAALEIGRSPLPGRALRLSDGMIRSRVRRLVEDARLILVVPERSEVTRAALRIPGSEIEEMVLARAAAEAGASPDDLRQELKGTIPDAVLPKGDVEWQIEPMGRHIASSGERTYLIAARVNGQDAWRTTVRLKQKVYEEAIVAAKAVRRNQTITAQDVKIVKRTFTGNDPARAMGSLEQVVGKQARRPIGQNELIVSEMLLEPHDVEEGGRVIVVFSTSQIHLEVPGVAMVNGRSGDFIPVKNLQSGKIVYGVIDGGNTVRVN